MSEKPKDLSQLNPAQPPEAAISPTVTPEQAWQAATTPASPATPEGVKGVVKAVAEQDLPFNPKETSAKQAAKAPSLLARIVGRLSNVGTSADKPLSESQREAIQEQVARSPIYGAAEATAMQPITRVETPATPVVAPVPGELPPAPRSMSENLVTSTAPVLTGERPVAPASSTAATQEAVAVSKVAQPVEINSITGMPDTRTEKTKEVLSQPLSSDALKFVEAARESARVYKEQQARTTETQSESPALTPPGTETLPVTPPPRTAETPTAEMVSTPSSVTINPIETPISSATTPDIDPNTGLYKADWGVSTAATQPRTQEEEAQVPV